MDDKSGDDNTGEVRWSWRSEESGRGRSDRNPRGSAIVASAVLLWQMMNSSWVVAFGS